MFIIIIFYLKIKQNFTIIDDLRTKYNKKKTKFTLAFLKVKKNILKKYEQKMQY